MTTNDDKVRAEYHGDQPTKEDLLGFREHAQRLADEISLFDPNLPMVVGIEGKWGEGKSSFLLMMEEHWRNQYKLPPEKPKLEKGWWLPCRWKSLLEKQCCFFFGTKKELAGFYGFLQSWLGWSEKFKQEKNYLNSGLVFFKLRNICNWAKDLAGNLPKGQRTVRLIKFDPWWFSGSDKLLERFIDEIKAGEPFYAKITKNLLDGLKNSLRKDRKVWQKFISAVVTILIVSNDNTDNYMKLVFHAIHPDIVKQLTGARFKTLIDNQNIALSALLAIVLFPLLGLLCEWVSNIIIPSESIEKKRMRLEAKLKRSSIQRIMVIDDVDRLPEDEQQELFRVIKSVANMPNITYIILYDREVVSTALNKFYPGHGKRFLEKIVQKPVFLPMPTQHVQAKVYYDILCTSQLKDEIGIPEYFSGRNRHYHPKTNGWFLICDGFIPNIRQAKRLRGVITVNYCDDLLIDQLTYIFLEALRLHDAQAALILCQAMAFGYDTYPENKEHTGKILSNQLEWMVNAKLMNNLEKLELPFCLLSKQAIECIAYFTGLPFASKNGFVYECTMPDIKNNKNSPKENNLKQKEIQKIFMRYLQLRFSEENLSPVEIENKLFNIENQDALIYFIELRFKNINRHGISHQDIANYFGKLTDKKLSIMQENLKKTAAIAMETAEMVYMGSDLDIILSSFIIDACMNIFHAACRLVPNSLKDELIFAVASNTPIFYFGYRSFEGSEENSGVNKDIMDKCKKAVMEKYSYNQILPIIYREKNREYPCLYILNQIFLSTKLLPVEELTKWIAEIPEPEKISDKLNKYLQQWMILSLEVEGVESKLFHQIKLKYLIEPIMIELERTDNKDLIFQLQKNLEQP